jgi:SAM-dependent methyltransferase
MSLEIQHDPKNEAEITYWNSAGGQRWVERQQSQDIVLGPILQATLERAQVQQGERVVDIGCGTGASSIALAERIGSTGEVLGVDVSAPMLARAAERLPPGAPVKFVRADATTYRFEAAAFDLLFSRFERHVFRGASPGFCQPPHGSEGKRTARLRLLAQVR